MQNVGLNSEYLRINTELPDVDVPKGTLVRVDPDCEARKGLNCSIAVIVTDHFDEREEAFGVLKLAVIWKVIPSQRKQIIKKLTLHL